MTSKFEERLAQVEKPAVLNKYFAEENFPDKNMTLSQIADFQRDALKNIVTRAYEKCSFYHQKFSNAGVTPKDISDISDLSKLPLTNKDELRGDPWVLLACDKKDLAIISVSTGTTGGEQIYVPYTWRDYYPNEMAPGYPKLVPVERGDLCLNALPYEMSSAGLSFHKTFIDACQATVMPAGKGGAYSTPEKTVKVIRDLKPTVVITTPSWAITLAETAEKAGFELAGLNLKKMWLTGEGCSPSFRKRVEKIWGVTANCYYGSLEAGGVGVECDAHEGYHLLLGHVIVEIIDPITEKVLEPGEIGEIVVTCLLRFDTPLIRYRTQDLGYIDPSPCKCGVSLPRLTLRGRLVDQIEVQGVSFSPFYFEEFLMRLPEVGNWYQFIASPKGMDRLKIRAELAKGVKRTKGLADKLASKMEYGIGIPCEFELVKKIPRTVQKTVRVVWEDE